VVGKFQKLLGIDMILTVTQERQGLGETLQGADDEVETEQKQKGSKPSGAIKIVKAKLFNPPDGSRAEMLVELMFGDALGQQSPQDRRGG
jgi:hypothetical protein